MFRDYSDFCDDSRRQHNVMALIGNGFDVAVMSKYNNKSHLDWKLPKYEQFYDFLSYKADKSELERNIIYQEMTKDKDAGLENWSDFELIIDRLVRGKKCSSADLRKHLDYVQGWFSKFLNTIVTADILIEVNRDSMTKKWAKETLSMFLGDLNGEDHSHMSFPYNILYYDIFNFLFVNFNYTMLLDNYLYLDRVQFDPTPNKTVDRNFIFYPAPQLPRIVGIPNEDTNYSTYLFTEVVHPHGYMDIPRSMIFGTELDDYDPHGKDNEKLLVKSYWARDEVKYSKCFKDTELFIIYGMSITNTDAWWFDRIYEQLESGNSELIIYYYVEEAPNDSEEREVLIDGIKDKFINACIRNGDDERVNSVVKNKIQVVHFNTNDTSFLGLKDVSKC